MKVRYKISGWNEQTSSFCTNIGRGGVCLLMSEKLQKGTPLELEFSPLHQAAEEPIVIRGKVAWSKEFGGSDDSHLIHRKELTAPQQSNFAEVFGPAFRSFDLFFETGVQFEAITTDMWVRLFSYIPSVEMFDRDWSINVRCKDCVHYREVDAAHGTCFGVEIEGERNPKDSELCEGKYFVPKR